MAAFLILDDEPIFRRNLRRELSQYGRVFEASNLDAAQAVLETQNINVAFVDLNLNNALQDNEGLQLIKKCSDRNVTSVVLTGNEEKSMITKSYDLGCHYYFSKLDFEKNLHKMLGPLLKSYDNKLQHILDKTFITRDKSLISKIRFLQEQSHLFEQNIMITGPTGVGKTQIAKMIHKFYGSETPFVHVNLSELPEGLIESELFGHKKGAFTGATADKMGFMEKANGGILFFDEIGAIPLNIQKKLLKVIEEKRICPVGAIREKRIEFKLITATCDDISKKIQEGDFRMDFYFRIKGTEINVSPLAKRKCDIFPIIDNIISKSPKKIAFDKDAHKALLNYEWFGNVRELENVIRELIISSAGLVSLKHLPSYILQNKSPFSTQKDQTTSLLNEEIKTFIQQKGLPSFVKHIEQEALENVIKENIGGVNEIIRRLQISKTLFYRIQKDKASTHSEENV